LPYTDNLLGARNNEVVQGKMMQGRTVWWMAPFMGSRWRGEATGKRRQSVGEVEIYSMVSELKQGKGNWGIINSLGGMKATG
jgi:hypothetical protein